MSSARKGYAGRRLLGARMFLAVTGAWALGLSLLCRPALGLEYSELERRTVLRALGPAPDREDAPEGRRIESVEVVRLPVFDDDDPVPDFVNLLHAQSREAVIRRELLFQAGDLYSQERVEETIRNLQQIPQFGVVVVVPMKSKRPGYVRPVVLVRDVWSLRFNFALEGSLTNVSSLLINPVEENLLGTRTRLGAVFTMQPDRYALGALLGYPRIAGTQVDALAFAGVYNNLDSGKTEGSFGTFSVRQDLLSLSDKWGFLVGTAWTIEQTRLLQESGVHIDYHWPPSASIVVNSTLSKNGIPIEYASSIVRAGGEVARSFGTVNKTVLTWGVELNRRRFKAKRAEATPLAEFEAFVREELPVSDTRFSPFVQVEHRSTRYLATRDVDTLELQESFSLGQQAALRVYPAARDAGSSRDLLGTVSWLGYTWPLHDGYLRVVANSSIETANDAKHQASAQGALRLVSPRLPFARFVFDTAVVSTYRNYLNRKLVMGGETRPRGYVPGYFRAPSGFAASIELRTFAINILSARVAGVAFYDVGGVGERVQDARLKQSLGAGVRILFPQLNRACFRLDWAAPLSPGRGRFPDKPLPGAVYFTFGQAFDIPKLKTPEILGAETSLLEFGR